jgi:hypothetical protein
MPSDVYVGIISDQRDNSTTETTCTNAYVSRADALKALANWLCTEGFLLLERDGTGEDVNLFHKRIACMDDNDDATLRDLCLLWNDGYYLIHWQWNVATLELHGTTHRERDLTRTLIEQYLWDILPCNKDLLTLVSSYVL